MLIICVWFYIYHRNPHIRKHHVVRKYPLIRNTQVLGLRSFLDTCHLLASLKHRLSTGRPALQRRSRIVLSSLVACGIDMKIKIKEAQAF